VSTEIHIFRHSKERREVAAGEVIFEQGAAGDKMYAVVEGELEVFFNGHIVDRVRPGGIVGEMALIDNSPRSSTVKAAEASVLAEVDKRHFLYLVQEHPTFALDVMSIMADRLRRVDGLNNC
jgi:CRP-like cAMP-binding protein